MNIRIMSIMLINFVICLLLLFVRLVNIELERSLSFIIYGMTIGFAYTIISWFTLRLPRDNTSKRNLTILLNCILGIGVFGFTSLLNGHAIFGIPKSMDEGIFVIVVGGGLFGLFMGFGFLFDYGLFDEIKYIYFIVACFGFLTMIIWYYALGNTWFIIIVILSRIFSSIFANRIMKRIFKENITLSTMFALSLLCFILPLTILICDRLIA